MHLLPIDGKTIVDFGCGSGLSLLARDSINFMLVGVDVCSEMRKQASQRGMTVWSPADLARQPKGSIDGAFASYVFHFLPHMGGFQLLWSRLKNGGVVVANFHKGEGLNQVVSGVKENGGEIIELKKNNDLFNHGLYYGFARKK